MSEPGADARITYQCCGHCDARWYLDRDRCPRCGTRDPQPRQSEGTGTVFALTTVFRAPDAAFQERAPYRIALVDLDDGIRVMGHLIGDAAAIGSRVTGGIESVGGRSIPVFRPVAGNTPGSS